jgi:hypothetical protein
MRTRTRENFAVMMTALLLTTMVPARAQQPENAAANAGFFAYSGGAAKAKRARTRTFPTGFQMAAGYTALPLATLTYVVPDNQSELFNVAFSAECAKTGGGPMYIAIFHSINGVAQPPLEPFDGAQDFCSGPNPATHAGLWVRRVGEGTHVLQVMFLNPGPAGSVGTVDDWTFELVVYE